MALMMPPQPISLPFTFILLFLFHSRVLPISSQSQNIETFYPSPPPPAAPRPSTPWLVPPPPHQPPPLLPFLSPPPSPSTTIVKAVAATAAGSVALAGLFYFLLQLCLVTRRKKKVQGESQLPRLSSMHRNDIVRFDGVVRGLIVDEDGLDVLYWRMLKAREEKSFKSKRSASNGRSSSFRNVPDPSRSPPTRYTNQKPDIGTFSSSWSRKYGEVKEEATKETKQEVASLKRNNTSDAQRGPSLPSPPRPPQELPQPVATSSAIQSRTAQVGLWPLPLPPALQGKTRKEAPVPPPPPPKASGMAKPPPPPPYKTSGSTKPPPPPPFPPGKAVKGNGEVRETSTVGASRMKPLHWEKVEVNGDHSMVWDKIGDGSFRVDHDLMEALFGSVATNRKTPLNTGNPSKASNSKPDTLGKIFILDARKSQNIAIVLKSIGASQREILEALSEGQGLTTETLEKLDRITLTKEEQSQIAQFDGNPSKLADAESFLHNLLRACPSAFTRFRAMLFKLNYDSDISNLSETIQTLELACEELRARGVFVKLLEAILKAGNRMNAGTTRGNASAFDLNSLRKLSDVKSTDGKTTLLHFVVEEVIRSEGKRCVLNRSRRLSRTFSQSSSDTSLSSDSSPAKTKEERRKEYVMLGLPVVGCLGVEFSNVKKAAGIDYSTFSTLASGLMNRLSEIRQLVLECANDQSGFQKEMKEFLKMAEEETDSVRKEQENVMDLVKKTTEYYQAGGSRENGAGPLQIFVIVKDFLGMVDQVCLEIARNLQKSKRARAKPDSSSEKLPAVQIPVKFRNLPLHSVLQKSSASGSSDSSNSDTDF
ncbi:formin-like protein 4 [Punica granatum]|uniref:Formin-like protein n=2 Tax=Punica granatum TaxID=22663 RepID=A0A218XXQ0_PUNGR|nr:formin-like protein 4 [Punica granatum]OWM89610.1 hypothetical protein CDL15_Pgr024358 [Punica granatum]PKI47227.1 hypothetical protein CRG98_032364 [Punica granatum]